MNSAEASITVVLRESLSIGVPGELWQGFSDKNFPRTDLISVLLIPSFELLHEDFWDPFIKALNNTLPIMISMTGNMDGFFNCKTEILE